MTAQGIGIFTVEFADPYARASGPTSSDTFVILPADISFQYPISAGFRTLSPNGAPSGNFNGLLFVPQLQSHACKDSEKQHVSENSTRLRNLPPDTQYDLIAIAPWMSGQPLCMQEYFISAQQASVKAMLVYQAFRGNSAEQPPPMSDPSWGLSDGGNWKSSNHYPVYALAPLSGATIVQQMSLYAGNITSAPNGPELETKFGPHTYVRLLAAITLDRSDQLPSLWVFLVIVLGLLIFIVGVTSFSMHLVQRRRRNSLRQRVVNGEVDLEALGVKRLTVPRTWLDKLPVYTYSVPKEHNEKTGLPTSPDPPNASMSLDTDPEMGIKRTPSNSASSIAPLVTGPLPAFSQPTCAICLDDFEPDETKVRELPCRHIFHPDCIDTFLLKNSSLCPMCKKSTLPPGSCPTKITNMMVRRERMIRRMQERSAGNQNRRAAQPGDPISSVPPSSGMHIGSLGIRTGPMIRTTRRVFSAPEPSQPSSQSAQRGIEMTDVARPATAASASRPTLNDQSGAAASRSASRRGSSCSRGRTPSPTRREWARQRALALIGYRNAPPRSEDEDPERRPAWRRVLSKAFPGYW